MPPRTTTRYRRRRRRMANPRRRYVPTRYGPYQRTGGNMTARAILSGRLYRFKRMVARPVVAQTGITVTNPANLGTNWSIAAGIMGAFSVTAALSDLQGSADFTVLFDQYQLRAIKFTISYRYSEGENSAVNNQLPWITTVNDYDDAVVPTSELQLSEYSNARKRYFANNRRSLSYFFRPKFNMVTNDGVTTAGCQLPRLHPWIDIAAPSIQHWGLKGIINNPSPGTAAVFDVSAKYYLSFKVVR